MKKLFAITFLALLVISMIGVVSAVEVPGSQTVVAGRVYNFDYTETVAGADVTVTCTHNDVDSVEDTLSLDDGTYSVQFDTSKCDLDDSITVLGYHEDYGYGDGDGTKIDVDMAPLDVKLGVSNIPLVPEFGLFIGALTIMSAVGVFFLVRRD